VITFSPLAKNLIFDFRNQEFFHETSTLHGRP